MKHFKLLLAIAVIAFFFSGCGAYVQSPVSGYAYTEVKAPLTATSNTQSSKVGTAEATSILGIVAQGDASIEAAIQSAGITEIHHIDYEANSILGLYATYTIYVYGE